MAFDIYKRGQGKYTRLCTAFGLALIVGLGCWRLYSLLVTTTLGLWSKVMIPAGVFVVSGGLVFWLVNKANIANFMIASEGEMKKVNWSSRKEIAVSTLIVIIVIFILAVFLGVTDITFRVFFKWLLD